MPSSSCRHGGASPQSCSKVSSRFEETQRECRAPASTRVRLLLGKVSSSSPPCREHGKNRRVTARLRAQRASASAVSNRKHASKCRAVVIVGKVPSVKTSVTHTEAKTSHSQGKPCLTPCCSRRRTRAPFGSGSARGHRLGWLAILERG